MKDKAVPEIVGVNACDYSQCSGSLSDATRALSALHIVPRHNELCITRARYA